MLQDLKKEVFKANMKLPKFHLVTFTWGNVSGIDREKGVFVIKPSGIPYEELEPDDMVVVNLRGEVVEGKNNPSSDTPTHAYLYNHFPKIGGIVHTHSPWAVSFAAANMDIPALNTTHADTFYTDIPIANALTKKEIEQDYEGNTGKTIVQTFKERELNYELTPGTVVSQHGPFTWGESPDKAVYNAKVLEIVAQEDYHTLQLTRRNSHLPKYLLDKHYDRKHGKNAYYGQNNVHSVDNLRHIDD